MEKRILKIMIAIMMLAAFCTGNAQAVQNIEIEQVSINKPDIKVYFYTQSNQGLTKKNISARLGKENCTTNKVYSYKDNPTGIRYYLLIDISASIPDNYFENYKKGILSLVGNMSEKDEIVLISFGNQIKTEYEGKAKQKAVKQVLDQLKNNNQNTLFYESIEQIISYVSDAKDDKRNIVAVFSDGEDCAKGSVTKKETLKILQERQIPLYAMAVDMGNNQYINTFGEFARETGGKIYVLSAGKTENALLQMQEDLWEARVAEFETENNVISGKTTSFLLTLKKEHLKKKVEVTPYKWKEDKVAPEISDVELKKNNQIEITFSEAVLHAGKASNYELVINKKSIIPVKAAYENQKAVLTMSEDIKKGNYVIKTRNICDYSMEENPLEKEYEVYLQGRGKLYLLGKFLLHFWWVWLIVLILLVMVIVLIRLGKKRKSLSSVTEEKIVIGEGTEFKHHVVVQQNSGFPVELLVRTGPTTTDTIAVMIDGSIMVGRSEMNDLYFDDNQMSKQHFVLAVDETHHVYIEDLQSTNGTMVNGVRIYNRRKLESGDRISAGSVEMTIRW